MLVSTQYNRHGILRRHVCGVGEIGPLGVLHPPQHKCYNTVSPGSVFIELK